MGIRRSNSRREGLHYSPSRALRLSPPISLGGRMFRFEEWVQGLAVAFGGISTYWVRFDVGLLKSLPGGFGQ